MILLLFFFWRIFLFIPLLVGEKLVPFRTGYEFTTLWKYIQPYFPVNSFLLSPWANFDGIHYLRIAGEGYSNNLGFLPLFPMTIFFVSFLFGGGEMFDATRFFVGFFLANLFFLVSLWVFLKLLCFDYTKKQAYQVIVFLLVFPTSFFFGSIYSESLFLLLAVASFYFARKKQWLLSSICGFLLAITRIVGIFIFVALLIEFFQQERVKEIWQKAVRSERFRLLRIFLSLCLIPVSIIVYGIYNFWQKGDFLYFLHAHGNLGNGRAVDALILLPQTVYRYLAILFSVSSKQFEWWIALFEICIFFFVSMLLVIGFKKKIRLSYLVFAALCFLLPSFSGTFTGLPRYSLILFPIFIVLMLLHSKIVKVIYVIIATSLLFLLIIFFAKGYFIA